MTPEEQDQIFTENRSSLWSPYNLQVLLHHYASSARFPRDDAPAYPGCLRTLRQAGLMEMGSTRLTLAGGRFVIALCSLRPVDPGERMQSRLVSAIRDALIADPELSEGDRVRTIDAAIDFYQRAKRGRPRVEDPLVGIVEEAMRNAPPDCGCVGPKGGDEFCRCEIHRRSVVATAVAAIRKHFNQET